MRCDYTNEIFMYVCIYIYVYFIDYTVLSQCLVVMTRCDQIVADLDIVYIWVV